MGFFDFGTIFFLVAAVVIFFQLRNVLGRRTGSERPPFDPYTAGRTRDDAQKPENVVSLPRKRAPGEPANDAYAAIDAFAKPDTDLNKGLRAIKDNDPAFDPKSFVDGAKMAYEMIVMAYADGDRKTLKNLLSREVYDGFLAAIGDREAKSEKIQSS
ncbi:MAG: Tim44/TimA family putative adaptor protein, partial [Mesorhizobium sp.]